MKLHTIRNLFVALVLGTCTQSCLDLEPKDQLAETNYWQTTNDFKLFANQFYGWVRQFSEAMYSQDDKPAHSDYFSDLFTNKDLRNIYSNGTNTVLPSDKNYTDDYARIRRTNLLLQNAENYPSQEDIQQYIGEARFFRAYSYFDLLQLYGNAIIVDRPMELTDPGMYVEQNDRSEVADFIVKDLQEAARMLPAYAEVTEEGRVSSEAAWAFLSRVALYEGTWQKFRGNVERGKELLDIAAKAAQNVMNSKAFELFAPESLGEKAQKYMFILENTKCNPAGLQKDANKEYIFVRRYDEIIAPINWNITQSSLNNAIWITRKFANMYLCQNGLPIEYGGTTNPQFQGYDKMDSEFQSRDNRMRYTMMKPHDKFWNNLKPHTNWTDDDPNPVIADFKPSTGTGYHNQKWATERAVADKNEGYDYPVIRYAEVLLNFAEAMYERDDQISDADLDRSLNLVRLRVNPNMPKLSNSLIENNPGMDMRTEIRRERTIELFNEGFRLDDLKRWKTAETEMPMDLVGIKWKGTEYETAWSTCPYAGNLDSEGCIIIETGRVWEEKNYLFPLPTDQLQLNPNLKQNPGWEI